MSLTRRKFINILMGVGGIGSFAAILYPIFSYLIPPKIAEANISSIKVGSVANFPPNSSKIIKFGRKPVIIVRTINGDFFALEATCTHLDCIVQYDVNTTQIICACHNGTFDLKGRNISGPPPKPLMEFNVTIVEENIVISKLG